MTFVVLFLKYLVCPCSALTATDLPRLLSRPCPLSKTRSRTRLVSFFLFNFPNYSGDNENGLVRSYYYSSSHPAPFLTVQPRSTRSSSTTRTPPRKCQPVCALQRHPLSPLLSLFHGLYHSSLRCQLPLRSPRHRDCRTRRLCRQPQHRHALLTPLLPAHPHQCHYSYQGMPKPVTARLLPLK